MGCFSEYRARCQCGGYASFQWGEDMAYYDARNPPPPDEVEDLLGQTASCNQCDRVVRLVPYGSFREEWHD